MVTKTKIPKEQDPTYVLFGEEPSQIFLEGGFRALVKWVKEYGYGYTISVFTKESTIADILGEAEGWCGYAFLTEIEYKKLSKL